MATCVLCSKTLKFINKPTMGFGKFSTGEELCFSCYQAQHKVTKSNKMGQFTLAEFQQIMGAQDGKNQQLANRAATIQQELKDAGVQPGFLGRKEINELPKILNQDEKVISLVPGVYNKGFGILVATSKRLIFIDKGLIYGLKIEDFGLDKVSSIQYSSGILTADIVIMASGNAAKIESVDKAAGRDFCDKARELLSQKNAAPAAVVMEQVDVAGQLEKFAGLKEKGIITQEEFDAQKKKLLGL